MKLRKRIFTSVISQKLLEEKNTVIFHYAGHADPKSLHLKDGPGFIEGLSPMLGRLTKLKLVFLNGCTTKAQVDFLFRQKVKAVIATSVPVGDQPITAQTDTRLTTF